MTRWHWLLGLGSALTATWVVLAIGLLLARPKGALLKEALRLLPDTIRLLRRLASDESLPRGARVRLWLVFAYLAMPIDLIPDVIPIIGYADDAIIVCWALRSIIRRAGPEVVRRHWPGTEAGLAALGRVAGL